MIRQPKNENEKIFLETFGEKEFDAIIDYQDDCFIRKINLVEEMNQPNHKKDLTNLIKNFCMNLNKGLPSNFSLDYSFIQNGKLDFINYATDNYKDSFEIIGESSDFCPIFLTNFITLMNFEFGGDTSRLCTSSTHDISLMPLCGMFQDTPIPDYHKKEEFFYFYNTLMLHILPKSPSPEIWIPIANLFFGELDKKWIITEYYQDNNYEIPSYPNKK